MNSEANCHLSPITLIPPHLKDKPDFVVTAAVPLAFSRGCSKHTGAPFPLLLLLLLMLTLQNELYVSTCHSITLFWHAKNQSSRTTTSNLHKGFFLCTKLRCFVYFVQNLLKRPIMLYYVIRDAGADINLYDIQVLEADLKMIWKAPNFTKFLLDMMHICSFSCRHGSFGSVSSTYLLE